MLELQLKSLLFKYFFKTFKKLVLVLAIFIPIIKASKKNKVILEKILYIYHLLYFQKNNAGVKV